MKYRKKPVVVEAVKWNGENHLDITQFTISAIQFDSFGTLWINTLEGNMKAEKGDYIIKGVQGEFYPCKPDIFEQTYEEVSYE
ncbi:hypothetical protein [Streptococcus suis]